MESLADPGAAAMALSPEEESELYALLEAQQGGEALEAFIRRVAPREPPPPHLRVLVRAIERARERPMRLCLSMPPRHGKTITILRAIAWWMNLSPADTHGYFSYNAEFALSKSRTAREIARRSGVQLAKDSTAVGEWRTTRGGGLIAGGVGGSLTGHGITGFVVVDDPFKNREEADSETNRRKVWEWFNEVVMTRLEGGSVFVVHTRWHEDDLIGRLERADGWEHIRLPAIAEATDEHGRPVRDVIGRRHGEALWPSRFPAAMLGTEPDQKGTLRGQIGEFSFSALYQQAPRPRGSKLFGAAHYYDPARLDLTGCRLVIGGDPAASEKTVADYSVGLVLAVKGRGPDMEGWILDVDRKQRSVPDFARVLRAMQLARGNCPVYVEAVSGFKAVPQLLRENDKTLTVEEAPALGDKFQRAQLASAAWNSGRLMVPLSAPWLKDFLYEVQMFTGVKDPTDDQVDALAHAWNAMALEPEPPAYEPPPTPIIKLRR